MNIQKDLTIAGGSQKACFTRLIFLQRPKHLKLVILGIFINHLGSKGYQTRPTLSVNKIGELIAFVKSVKPDVICMVDNCYGEFVERTEPSDVVADMVVGSLIKNPGGGLAPIGGYIAVQGIVRLSYRRKQLIPGTQIAHQRQCQRMCAAKIRGAGLLPLAAISPAEKNVWKMRHTGLLLRGLAGVAF